MIIRLILIKFPHYRQVPLKGCNIVINGRRVEQSILFLSDYMPTRRIDSLCKAMAMMHCPAPRWEQCPFNTVIAGVIRTARATAGKIVLCSFLLEFSALGLYKLSQKALLKLCIMNAMDFATSCWDAQLIPITCRYGQQRTWHAQLCGFARDKAKGPFIDLVSRVHRERVVTYPEATVLHHMLLMEKGYSRMQRVVSLLSSKSGYGAASVYNLVGVLIQHKMLCDVVPEELNFLPSGVAVSRFWKDTGICRVAMLEAMRGLCARIRDVEISGQKMSLRELGLEVTHFDERMLQFWSGAYGRTLVVEKGVFGAVAHPVRYYMRPNSILLSTMNSYWNGEGILRLIRPMLMTSERCQCTAWFYVR